MRDVVQSRSDCLSRRHTAGELRHISDVAVVFGAEDQVHKKSAGLSHKRILQQRRQRELKICSFQEC